MGLPGPASRTRAAVNVSSAASPRKRAEAARISASSEWPVFPGIVQPILLSFLLRFAGSWAMPVHKRLRRQPGDCHQRRRATFSRMVPAPPRICQLYKRQVYGCTHIPQAIGPPVLSKRVGKGLSIPSFRRKPESRTLTDTAFRSRSRWIPAFAGMTGSALVSCGHTNIY